MASEFSIWLLPAAEDAAMLQGIVEELSGALHSPVFTPHLTIQGDIALPKAELEAALSSLAARTAVQRWPVQQIECTEHVFRCLYLRFGKHAAFAQLQQASLARTGTRDGLSPFPHVSLAYAEPHPRLEELAQARRAEWVGRDILFDRLAIWRSSREVAVPDWACVAQFPLQWVPSA